MNLLGPVPSPEILDPLERIFRQALVRGAPRPYAVVVEDRGGLWKTTLARLSPVSRRAVMLAAHSGGALSCAARWSVGGALLLPPSTATMTAGLVAAREAAGVVSVNADPVVMHDLAQDPRVLRVAMACPGAWRALSGERRMAEVLVALAEVLGGEPLIDVEPSLLVYGVDEHAVRRAWAEVENRPPWSMDDTLHISKAAKKRGPPKVTGCVLSGSWPVAELPSGRTVGRWSFDETTIAAGEDLSFLFEGASGWSMVRGDGSREVIDEITDPADLAGCESGLARVPGWVSLDLDRAGSPGAVLVTALSREAARRGAVLWIPGVTAKTLPVVMRLEGRIWVDGPAVPDTRSSM